MHPIHFTGTEIHEKQLEDFQPIEQVVVCYLEVDGHLLVLESATPKPKSGKWGVPRGKLEGNTLPEEAARKTLFEETGIEIEKSQLEEVGTLYMRSGGMDSVYHLFKIVLDAKSTIQLSDAYIAYLWAKVQDLKALPLFDGEEKILQKYRTFLARRRITASVNAFLILRDQGQILLMLRQNTGFLDEHWGLVSGHVEPGESATQGVIREAKEELGIEISPDEIRVVHVMHRKTNRLNVDIFFECVHWTGDISNQEPEKCEAIAFFFPQSFPSNTIDYNLFALDRISQGQCYSEWGFL